MNAGISYFAKPQLKVGDRVRFTVRWPDARVTPALVCGTYPGDLGTVIEVSRRERGDYIVVCPDADRHGNRRITPYAYQVELAGAAVVGSEEEKEAHE